MNTEQRKWLNAALYFGRSFVHAFAVACFAADDENFRVIEPVLIHLMKKYPDYLGATRLDYRNANQQIPQMNTEQRNWLNAALYFGGSFVHTFAVACFAADDENFRVIEPVLIHLMKKYPDYLSEPFQARLRG